MQLFRGRRVLQERFVGAMMRLNDMIGILVLVPLALSWMAFLADSLSYRGLLIALITTLITCPLSMILLADERNHERSERSEGAIKE